MSEMDALELIATLAEESNRLEALAASRLELLRRCQEFIELSEKYIPGDLFYRDNLHDELAEELGDE